MPRPLFRKTTDELEQMFEECGNSPEQLRILAEELRHRERPKAVALSKKVEAALLSQFGSAGIETTSASENPELNIPAHANVKDGQTGKSQPQSQTAKPSFQDFAPPEQFTLVQPIGSRPRPNAFRPTLKNDLHLPISSGDSQTKIFRLALAELIREMKRRRIGHQKFTLEDGVRLATEAGGYSYQFEFGEEANIFEGAKVELIIGGRVITGNLTSILQGCIIISIQEDFGPDISSCILRIDSTALLQALHDRLEKIEQGEVAGILSVRRRSTEELERGVFTEPENPRCEKCSGWSVLIRGKYGLFFACGNGCEWKQNVDTPQRKRS